MEYIVIDKFGGWEYAAIVTDEEGNNKVFDNLIDAQKEADECQDGIVVWDDMILQDALEKFELKN